MKKLAVLMAVCVLILGMTAQSLACTGIVAGKGATADGGIIMGRTEDIGAAYNKNFLVNPATEGEGVYTFTDPYNGFTMELPVAGCKWTMVSDVPEHDDGLYAEAVMNEYGVSMTATISTGLNESAQAADPLLDNGLREAYIPSVVMPYVATAKEGVLWLGNIIETYGSAEGNTVLFADADEIWVMEIVSGHQWAAQKVPDDCYAVIPNCMMLGYIDLSDPDNFLGSAALFTLPEEKGFLKTHNDLPHVALTYGSDMAEGNRVRAWGGQHFFSPSQEIPYETEVFSLFLKPDQPITLTAAMDLLGYRYEGTAYDANITGSRAIGTERTCEAHVFHYAPGQPLVQWECMGNAEHGLFVPAYQFITKTPAAYHVMGEAYDSASAYWTFRKLSMLAEIDRVNCGAGVKAYWDVYQQQLIDQIAQTNAQISALDAAQAAAFADELLADIAADALAKANVMTDELIFFLSRNASLSTAPRAPFVSGLMEAE